MQQIVANFTISVSDLKKNPSGVIAQANGETVAVLNHNRVMAYMVPADTFEAIMERLDEQELIATIKSRSDEIGIPVDIDEL